MNKETNYPKILIINGQSIYKENATGLTLRNILSGYPKDKLFELYGWKTKKECKESNKIESWQLKPSSLPLYYIFRKLLGRKCEYEYEEKINNNTGETKKQSFLSVLNKKVNFALQSSKIRKIDKKLLKKVDDFKPEIIYTIGTSVFIMNFALYFAKRYNIKIVLHYMDNWRESNYMDDKRTFILNKKLNKLVDKVEKHSDYGLTISKRMSEVYSKRYNMKYLNIMNTLKLDNSNESNYKSNDNITLLFMGGMHLNRHLALLETEQVLKKWNLKNQKKIALKIYTSDNYIQSFKNLFDSSITDFLQYVDDDKILEEYKKADILLHVDSFDDKYNKFLLYSITTKLPSYLASGKPLLYYAPIDYYSAEFVHNNGLGLVPQTVDDIYNCLEKLINDKDIIDKMSVNNKKYFEDNFSLERSHNTFMKVINENI